MKRLYFVLVLLFVGITLVQAQEEERRTPQVRKGSRDQQANENASGLPELTVRAQNMNEQLTRDIDNARWMRTIYREIDMLTEKNAPLYYPVTPVNGSMNLFTTIFQLAAEGKLPLYRYVDGYEAFDEDHLLNFKEDILDRFEIYYDEIRGRSGEERYVISESDIPSAEVKAFYIKEAWYFDQNNSLYDVKIMAICPIITRSMDFGDQTTPMFWLPYESVRPYVSSSYIMTSNLNNARTFTMDDYFRRRMFDGEIIKTENLLNLPLQAYIPTPDSMKSEQEKIEQQLVDFNKSLWFQPDTTQVATTDKKEAKKSASTGRAKQEKVQKDKSSTKSSGSSKTPKTKAPKTERSAPTRSVRRGG
ncbi:MAG: gliding motility protein GldN [Tannerella sp.]|jgi:gliding motility associated protien GldN|nr:gliding motility protein GldN [Tannerella sp.]